MASLIGLGAAALGLSVWNTTGYEVPPFERRRLRALTAKDWVVLGAAFSRILRSDDAAYPRVDPAELLAFVDGLVSGLDEAQRADLRRLVSVLEHALPISCGYASRFSRLDGARQDIVLARMSTSSVGLLRGGFDALKTLAVTSYFRDPRAMAAIGYSLA